MNFLKAYEKTIVMVVRLSTETKINELSLGACRHDPDGGALVNRNEMNELSQGACRNNHDGGALVNRNEMKVLS